MKINKTIVPVIVLLGLFMGSLGGGVFPSQWPLVVIAAQEPAPLQEDNNTDKSDEGEDDGRFCSQTVSAQYEACQSEVKDDFFMATVICLNISDEEEQEECFREAEAGRQEDDHLCGEQRQARQDLCAALGEDRYDPDFDAANFDDNFTHLTTPNPYLPLEIGHQWEYVGGDEIVKVEVLNETKLIEGVTCIVVNDRVEIKGNLVEDTDDWFAQAKDGTVWYCGEEVKDFETFEGDNPQTPELVSIEGSFKTGRDGDKPGILILRTPTVGEVYRQEWSPGNAEDAVQVLSTTYGFGNAPELDTFVPQTLAELLCANNCIVTGEFTPLEPDVFARKYYAPGIGLFLEVEPETGNIIQLAGCNFDPRCADLP